MKRTIAITLGLILLSFSIMCIALQYIVFPSKIVSEVSNDTWGAIISTFFAGTLGGLIAMLGIWGQLNHEKEVRSKSLKIYLEHIKEVNCEVPSQLFKVFKCVLKNFYSNDTFQINDGINVLFKEFESNYINQNLDEVLKLKNAKEILYLKGTIEDFNSIIFKNYLELSLNKEALLDSLINDCPSLNLFKDYCHSNSILLTYFSNLNCSKELLENFKKNKISIINNCSRFEDLKEKVLRTVNEKYNDLRLIKEKDIHKQVIAIETAVKINSEILYLLHSEIIIEAYALKDKLKKSLQKISGDLEILKNQPPVMGVRIMEGRKITIELLEKDIFSRKEKIDKIDKLLGILNENLYFSKKVLEIFNKIKNLEIK